MDETDILLTIAEIGVALAGFASLAAILGRRYKHTDPLVNAIRLRGLLDAGLSTMLLALIGVLMLQIGGSSRWVWQGSGIAGLVFVSAIGTAAFRREKLRRHLPGFRKDLSIIMFLLVATAFVGFAIVSTGLVGDFGFQIYFAMLCLLLVICCTMFVLVIASLMSSAQGDSEPSTQD
jgi:nitrate reductase NapE component